MAITEVRTKRLDIGERFARDTDAHQMTVLHDDGLYRHLHFRQPKTGIYWFDLITVPGTLIFQGDGESYVFTRIEDMFEFFRGPVGRINPQYWAEKLTSVRREGVMVYDEDIFKAHVEEAVTDALRDDPTLTGLTESVHQEVLDSDSGEIGFEELALRAVGDFAFYKNESDRYDYSKSPDFQFSDICDWNCRDYDWWFLWACHGIVWGIAQYDAMVSAGVTS